MENINKSRFLKGVSGNPKGRPRGKTTGATLRAQLAKELPLILASLVEAAKNGDVGAAKLVLDRVLPALRPTELPERVALTGDTLSEQGRSVLAAIGAGDIAVSHGTQLVQALASMARVVEIDELQSRIAALEANHGNA